MGKNNRARRAAKAKQRRSERQGAGGQGAQERVTFDLSPAELAAGLFDLAAAGWRAEDDSPSRDCVVSLTKLDVGVVDREVQRLLTSTVAWLWEYGWQPSELIRQARRATSAAVGRLAALIVVADHARWGAASLHPDWAEQVRSCGPLPHQARWFDAWRTQEGVDRPGALGSAAALLHELRQLGPLPEILPPPGSASPRRSRPGPAPAAARPDDPVLARVRALLAQAESTSFPAEAEAFTVKAHELITRHAIDRAVLDDGAGCAASGPAQPATRRLAVDEPYIHAKALLLQVVARATRCRAVLHPRYAMSSLIGLPADLDAVDLLYTSLLVQSQMAMAAEAKSAAPGARARRRSFRSSFLLGYAQRIGERLDEINRRVEADIEQETGRSLLPVLSARQRDVDDVVEDLFGELSCSNGRAAGDGVGTMRGRAAADHAQLSFGDLAAEGADASVSWGPP